MACIIAACKNPAPHNFSVRLRRPSTRAIWAPNTEAFMCDQHATQGLTVSVVLTPNTTGSIKTEISSPGGRTVRRTTPVVQPAKDRGGRLF
jgi:hypothetical protein